MKLTFQRRMFLMIHVLLLVAVYALPVVAQDAKPQATPLTAPPPRRTISRDERLQLDQARDSKRRVRLTIELANTHLATAELHTSQANYEGASVEVGVYHALLENVLAFLSSLKRDSNKTRDLYKTLELALRAHGPRLTSMRRTTPIEFAVWIKEAEDYAREGRTEALNSFYGHTVVRDSKKPQVKTDDKPKETPTPKTSQP